MISSGPHQSSITPTNRTSTLTQSDALLTLSRQETHLQSTLQQLLDAQSEGLLTGLTGVPREEDETSGSRTPTTTTSMNDAAVRWGEREREVIPVRQPVKRKIGLRGARRGIARAMSDLASLKGEQGRVLEGEVAQREDMINTVDNHERKSSGLRERIKGIESEDASRHVERLKLEEKGLGSEIHELETKLFEMKARHGYLLREIDALSNSVQSELSSYESALTLAEKDIKDFLARPPMMLGGMTVGKKEGMWALPKERRTLEMAREYFADEQQGLKGRLDGVQAEAMALEEGGEVWEGVVGEVDSVEKALREEMQRMRDPAGEGEGVELGMLKILRTMRKARGRLETKLDYAETNEWRLLVCCIGAELEAMIEGQAVLQGALEAQNGGGKPENQHGEGGSSSHGNGVVVGNGALIDDGSDLTAGSRDVQLPTRGFLNRSEDEDDGPGPELLISQHDD